MVIERRRGRKMLSVGGAPEIWHRMRTNLRMGVRIDKPDSTEGGGKVGHEAVFLDGRNV